VTPGRRATLLCAAIALVTVGCDVSTQPPPVGLTTTVPWATAPDAAQWEALDSICREANDELLGIAQELLPLDSLPLAPAEIAEYRTASATVLRRVIDRLRAVEPPPALAADWGDALAGLEDWVAWSDDLASVLGSVPDTFPDPEGSNSTVDQTPDPGLESFLARFEGGACASLFDIG